MRSLFGKVPAVGGWKESVKVTGFEAKVSTVVAVAWSATPR